MTIQELIKQLQALPNQERTVTVVVGNEDENSIDTCKFELHHCEAECHDHPLEIFVLEEANPK